MSEIITDINKIRGTYPLIYRLFIEESYEPFPKKTRYVKSWEQLRLKYRRTNDT